MATGITDRVNPRHRQAAWLCQDVYTVQPEDALSADLIVCHQQVICKDCGDSDTVDCVARIETIGDFTYISVRGTDSTVDWLANLDCRPCQVNGLTVGNGWKHGAGALLREVTARLHERGSDMDKLIITGHSKGGSEAAVLAYMLAWLGWSVHELVTFGSPRPGKGDFANGLAGFVPLITRYVNGPDPVTWAPPWHWGFRHVGRLIQLQPWSFRNFWRLGRPSNLITQYHAMHTYTQALEDRSQ